MSSQFQRFLNACRGAAVIFTVTCALFLLLNVFAQGAYEIAVATQVIETNPFLRKYGDAVRKSHPGMEMDELRLLLRETWGYSTVYDPVVQFKEPPRYGKYVNVDAAGFRHGIDQSAWPPGRSWPVIFVFGGSTTFGYNVRDSETLVSHFQEIIEERLGIKPAVYNFGRGNYSSTEEMLLFARLIFEGHMPDMAVFVDGLNEFQHSGKRTLLQTRDLQRLYDNYDSNDLADQLPRLIAALPVIKAINWFATTMGWFHPDTGAPAPSTEQATSAVGVAGRSEADDTLTLYNQNRRIIQAIANEMGVRTAFVWQPIPFYRYDLAFHPFRDTVPIWRAPGHVPGYRRVEELVRKSAMGEDFVWCAAIQEGLREQLYVDSVHYSNSMNRKVADCIFDGVSGRLRALRGSRRSTS